MTAPPAKSGVSAPFPNPSNAVMRAAMAQLWEYLTERLGMSEEAADAIVSLGGLPQAGGNMSGAINGNRMSVAGDATDTPIWEDDGDSAGTVETTGTPTITDFPEAPQAGASRIWYPAAGTVITHGDDIEVQGAANYTFEAGDWALVEALTTTTFRVTIFEGSVSSRYSIKVPQTVAYGPVDSSGYPNFGGSTGSTTVAASGTLVLTSQNGSRSHVWESENPSWTGLSTNGTMYLFDDESAGQIASTLAPIYQENGTPSTTNGQFTYNIKEGKAYVGNGTSAVQVYRVCVGQVTVASNVVSAITWYALMGSYVSPTFTLPPNGTAQSNNHNLGVEPRFIELQATCNTTENGYSVGDTILPCTIDSASRRPAILRKTALTVGVTAANVANPWDSQNKSTGASTALTPSRWDARFIVDRGW